MAFQIRQDLICKVCKALLEDSCFLPCQHFFCRKHFQYGSISCPTCRKSFNYNDLIDDECRMNQCKAERQREIREAIKEANMRQANLNPHQNSIGEVIPLFNQRPCAECRNSPPDVLCQHCKLCLCRPCFHKHALESDEMKKLKKAEADLNAMIIDLTKWQTGNATTEYVEAAERVISTSFIEAKEQLRISKSQLLDRLNEIQSQIEEVQRIIESETLDIEFSNNENIGIETLMKVEKLISSELSQKMTTIRQKIDELEKQKRFAGCGENIYKNQHFLNGTDPEVLRNERSSSQNRCLSVNDGEQHFDMDSALSYIQTDCRLVFATSPGHLTVNKRIKQIEENTLAIKAICRKDQLQ